MPKVSAELKALEVASLKTPGMYFVGGVPGLALKVTHPGPRSAGTYGARCWVMRVAVKGRRQELGVGGFPDVGLAEARRKASVMS